MTASTSHQCSTALSNEDSGWSDELEPENINNEPIIPAALTALSWGPATVTFPNVVPNSSLP